MKKEGAVYIFLSSNGTFKIPRKFCDFFSKSRNFYTFVQSIKTNIRIHELF